MADAAFAKYEAGMREYVTRCQKFAQGAPRALLPKSRSEIWVRNQVTRLLPYLPGKGDMGLQKTANVVKLKDYGMPVRLDAAVG
jgi:2-polyprenyl-6-methoxyphenol hydroxylase-like FAD-dependent oxidoreductase